MIKARIVSGVIVEVTGLDEKIAGKGIWRAALDKMGLDLQERIADSFANERVAGNSSLLKNSAKWNRFKARKNLDPRKGHATGALQRALDGLRLFTITAQRKGKARIAFIESRLHGRVFYSEFYEDKKVQRRGGDVEAHAESAGSARNAILTLANTWVQESLAIVKEVEAAATMKKSRAKRRAERRRRA